MFLKYAAAFLLTVSSTPLDDYVRKPDGNYSWYDSGLRIHGRNFDGSVEYTGYLLNMTSQQWLTPDDVTHSIWWHQLVVIVPTNLNLETRSNATLWITGGGNNCADCGSQDAWPKATDEDIWISAALAMGTGTITAALFQIPNQVLSTHAY